MNTFVNSICRSASYALYPNWTDKKSTEILIPAFIRQTTTKWLVVLHSKFKKILVLHELSLHTLFVHLHNLVLPMLGYFQLSIVIMLLLLNSGILCLFIYIKKSKFKLNLKLVHDCIPIMFFVYLCLFCLMFYSAIEILM